MPLEKEKAKELERLLDQVLETQFALRHKANARALPGQLREDISAVCDACQEHFSATAQKIRAGTAAESDMATLKTVHDNLTKANFLVDSVNLTLKAKENDSSFVAKLVSETKRIGNTLGEMIKDDSRSLGDKLFIGMKALVVSCLDAAVGAAKGIRQGYVENEGLVNTLGGMVKGGAKGALLGAASGAADAFMKDEDRARKQISDLRQSNANELLVLYDKVKDEQAPGFAANKARIAVLKEEQNYLSELENNLNSNPDQKTTKETIGSLRILSLTSAGSALMHTALETMHDFSSAQKFGGLEGPKALEKLGKDVVSATKNFNAVLDDASTSLPSKLFSVAKAFASSAYEGVKGALKGLAEGVAEGKGLSTIASAVKGAIFGGFSGLASGFNKSLEKDLAAKRESSELVMSSPSSMQKGQPPTITSTGPQTSMNAERSKEETEDHDDDYERGAHPV